MMNQGANDHLRRTEPATMTELTSAEMQRIDGGRGDGRVPDDPNPATCFENASKSEEYPVLFAVPCDG